MKQYFNWDFRTFDVDRDTRLGIKKTSALPPRQLVKYYEEVEETMGGREQTQAFDRLFTVPGSSGCPAFANPEGFKVGSPSLEAGQKGSAAV